MSEQQSSSAVEPPISLGLMEALAPIVARRPVHLIITASTVSQGGLHVVCQPERLSDSEDAQIGAGFAADGTAAEMDRELPELVSKTWVPEHQTLQTVLDQLADRTRQVAADKAKGTTGKVGKKEGNGPQAQTTLMDPATGGAPLALPLPSTDTADPQPAPAPAASSPTQGSAAAPAAPAETAAEPNAEGDAAAIATDAEPASVAGTGGPAMAVIAAPEQQVHAVEAPPATSLVLAGSQQDDVSSLFD
jgi:hypothetical protein